VVFIPKYRRKALYAELRRYLGGIFRTLRSKRKVLSRKDI
jgi:REP element-mobilizing transposase RayT